MERTDTKPQNDQTEKSQTCIFTLFQVTVLHAMIGVLQCSTHTRTRLLTAQQSDLTLNKMQYL